MRGSWLFLKSLYCHLLQYGHIVNTQLYDNCGWERCPIGTLGDRKDGAPHRKLGALLEHGKVGPPLRNTVLLATNQPLYIHLHLNYTIKSAAMSLGLTCGPALIWAKSFNLSQL